MAIIITVSERMYGHGSDSTCKVVGLSLDVVTRVMTLMLACGTAARLRTGTSLMWHYLYSCFGFWRLDGRESNADSSTGKPYGRFLPSVNQNMAEVMNESIDSIYKVVSYKYP